VAAAGLLIAGAATIARGLNSPAVTMVFTNVRLLPCVVQAAIPQVAPAAPAGGTSTGGTPTGGRTPSVPRAPFRPPVFDFPAGPLGDGFRDGADGRDPNLDLYEGSDRLLALIGVALGSVYLAMVTIWVALTRMRWNGGLRPRA